VTPIVFSRQAELDLEEIGDFIAADNPDRAVTFVREIRDHCVRIATSPLAYAARPEVGDGIRACPHGRYIIFFRPAEAHVLVVRVLAGARYLPEAFGRET
jgi:toxin ParE1/3/4